jgi:hypothetical protein
MVVVVLQTIPRPGKANLKQMDPRFHMSILTWKSIIPTRKRLITVSTWGLKSSGSLFPCGDHRMKTGIEGSPFPYGYGDCLLPHGYGNSKQMHPHFHTGIPIWKRGLTHPHIEMVNHRFYIVIEKFRLANSMWVSPYGNGD